MGETTEGSSNAAQSARPDTEEPNRGFFSRIVEALSPTDVNGAVAEDVNGKVLPAAPTPSLVNLRRMRVEDVSVPQPDIVAAPVDVPLTDLVELFRESGKTRLPVFDGSLDTPIGFVNLKDIALEYGFHCDENTFDLRATLRPLIYVPPSMSLGVLLQKMQAERTHMALVIDEYGGTDGLVTIEDLLEQVVGEIEDEHDLGEEDLWQREGQGCYIAQAKTPLDEFEAEIGTGLTEHEEIDEEEIETLGGLVFMLAGHVPTRGEVVQHPTGIEFEVLEADPRRIKRLKVQLPRRA
ncbi:hemolysin family protein [Aestuariibius sp. HNIBRBA575]|uniref:hemolysin family protein n=1 Tax=Aestuariibius sp. HNIBRBA575 TaxID=3233343 RepID=UPI0034A3A7B1